MHEDDFWGEAVWGESDTFQYVTGSAKVTHR